MLKLFRFLTLAAGLSAPLAARAAGAGSLDSIGVARIDITPSYPVRLTGYAARTNMGQGRLQTLWAKALAMGSDAAGPRLLITVDNCGVPSHVVEEVAGRLALRFRIRRENLSIASSHTHSGPMVRGFAENIFVRDLTPEEAAASDRYTVELMDRLESVAIAALRDRKPGRLFRGEGKVGFGANRRTQGGPVDPSLPVLVARDLSGGVRAVVANYACHCTTLGHLVNQAHADWAGFAQEFIEADHPGAVALITIGCGADTNPSPRGGDDSGIGFARLHGRALATEVKSVLAGATTELPELPVCAYRRILLPFEATPDQAGWEKLSRESGIVGYHATKNLKRLARGEKLPTHLPYFVQTWSFGDRLAMVFLAGEVVVDYALRMKREYDPARLWITAYANDVPCYIPSRRILQEGGYEAESSLWYYDRPARLKPDVEDLIHRTIGELMPPAFRSQPGKSAASLPPPLGPQEALRAFRLRPGLRIEAVAIEPLVESPVAIDFGEDGRLWVCEMRDYPSGMDGQGKPGGRIKVLSDTDGDGRYDKAIVVADELPFPTGLMAWRDGVIACAAPDVLWIPEGPSPARGPNDPRVKKLLQGFATHNFQARVNGLRWGLDGWVHASGGLFGGRIRSVATGLEVDCSGRDFRFLPDTGELEALSGVSQQVRCRDDYGGWFGNDNGSLIWSYPLPERYSRNNPHVAPPGARASMNRDDTRVYPVSVTLERFNDPQTANHLTSACGPEIYRDDLLGAEYAGNAFVCEPVHNLIRRAVVTEDGVGFSARRAPDETDREFLASEDNWFRPVEVRTGPDGALWVVDMYRFVVEHPRWIPEDRLRELDVRAGADRGRIYRVLPTSVSPRPIRAWAHAGTDEVAAGVGARNGIERDLAHRTLVRRAREGGLPASAVGTLERLAVEGHEGARVQAWFALAGACALTDRQWDRLAREKDPRVLRAILPLLEGRASPSRKTLRWLDQLCAGTDPHKAPGSSGLRFQALLTRGMLPGDSSKAGSASRVGFDGDPWIQSALLASARHSAASVLRQTRPWEHPESEAIRLLRGTLQTAVGEGRSGELGWLWETVVQDPKLALKVATPPGMQESWVPLTLGELLLTPSKVRDSTLHGASPGVRARIDWVEGPLLDAALQSLNSGAAASLSESSERAAILLLGEAVRAGRRDGERLLELTGDRLRASGQEALRVAWARQEDPAWGGRLVARWPGWTPATRRIALGAMLERESLVRELVGALERGVIRPVELDAPQRQRLLAESRPDLRSRAAALLMSEGSRADAVRAFAGTSELRPDPVSGRAHFERVCANCHRLHGIGQEVGPDLSSFLTKRVPDFLMAILDPNAAIDPRYLAYDLVLRDGREVSGLIRSESAAAVEVVQAGGAKESVLRSAVVRMTPQGRSLMPEGLEQGMAPQDFADLIGWMRRPSGASR